MSSRKMTNVEVKFIKDNTSDFKGYLKLNNIIRDPLIEKAHKLNIENKEDFNAVMNEGLRGLSNTANTLKHLINDRLKVAKSILEATTKEIEELEKLKKTC